VNFSSNIAVTSLYQVLIKRFGQVGVIQSSHTCHTVLHNHHTRITPCYTIVTHLSRGVTLLSRCERWRQHRRHLPIPGAHHALRSAGSYTINK
jgi:hypothetical protein